jgi:hypothetical protein
MGQFDSVYLEKEQRELLAWMVEAERHLRPQQRGPFLLVSTGQADFLIHVGGSVQERPQVRKGDLETLADYRLLRRDFGSGGNPMYEVSPLGRLFDAEQKRTSGEAIQTVEAEMHQYLDSDGFRARHRDTYERWRQAADELWVADTEAQFTHVGHTCREAMQLFATRLIATQSVRNASDDPTKTVDRVRAVLQQAGMSGARGAFLDALLAYWGTVCDLTQRQEHGAQKDGVALNWEDARRVVFQTALVMFEVDRAVSISQ